MLLGVTGGIAAYKTLELVRLCRRQGWEIQVVMTGHARKLVGQESFAALSGRQVATELFPKKRSKQSDSSDLSDRSDKAPIPHIDLATWADLVLVAPATANFLGKLASGIADDLLSTLLLAIPQATLESGRVVIAPAMNTNMWLHPSVTANVARLEKLGYVVVPPDRGELACGTSGPGRLPEIETLLETCRAALSAEEKLPDLSGIRVLLTAGRTEEPLDPVRVISNRSSGRLGAAVSRLFALARAEVTLVAGPTSVELPAGIHAERVRTTEEMLHAVLKRLPGTDVLLMCAAPADYRPARPCTSKHHEKNLRLELVRTPDILKAVSRTGHQALVIGFSLDPSVARAKEKLKDKKLNMVVANDYTTPGADTIRPRLITTRGRTRNLPAMSKNEFGRTLVREVAAMLKRKCRSTSAEIRTRRSLRRR